MQRRLGFGEEEIKTKAEIKQDEKKKENEARIKELEDKIDEEEARAAARDALEMKSLGDSDDEFEDARRRGAAMDLPEGGHGIMEWDLLKTQSLDFSDLLLARRGREDRYLRTSGEEPMYPYTAPQPFHPPAPSAPPLPDMLPSERLGPYSTYPRGPASPLPRQMDSGLQFDMTQAHREGTVRHPKFDDGLDEGLDVSAISDARVRLERFRRMREAVDLQPSGAPETGNGGSKLSADPAGRLRDFRSLRLQHQELAGLVA